MKQYLSSHNPQREGKIIMASAIFIASLLILSTVLFHYSVLKWLSGGMSRIAMSDHVRIVSIVFFIFVAHVIEVVLYAIVFAISVNFLAIGSFGGLAVEQPLDYLYFSIVSYTSLGLGDVYPGAHLRFLAGIEALNGLLLIAWSGSFIYMAMIRLWRWERCAIPDNRS